MRRGTDSIGVCRHVDRKGKSKLEYTNIFASG